MDLSPSGSSTAEWAVSGRAWLRISWGKFMKHSFLPKPSICSSWICIKNQQISIIIYFNRNWIKTNILFSTIVPSSKMVNDIRMPPCRHRLFKKSIIQSSEVLRPLGVDPYSLLMKDDKNVFDNTINCMVCIVSVQVGLTGRCADWQLSGRRFNSDSG